MSDSFFLSRPATNHRRNAPRTPKDTPGKNKSNNKNNNNNNRNKNSNNRNRSGQGHSKSKGGPTGKRRRDNLSSDSEDDALFDSDDDAGGDAGTDSGIDSDDAERSADAPRGETVDQRRIRLAKEFISRVEKAEGKDAEEGVDGPSVADRLRADAMDRQGHHLRVRSEPISALGSSLCDMSHYTRYNGHDLPLTCLALSSDDRTAFTGGKDCKIVRHDLETGKRIVFPGGRRLTRLSRAAVEASAAADRHRSKAESDVLTKDNLPLGKAQRRRGVGARVVDLGKIIAERRDRRKRIRRAAGVMRHPAEGTAETGWVFESAAMKKTTEDAGIPTGHTGHVLSLSATEDGRMLASGGADGLIRIWDLRSDSLIDAFRGHRAPVTGLSFRKGTSILYSASHDRTVRVWNCDEMGYMETLFGHESAINCLDAMTRERCVTGGFDHTTRMWKVPEETHLVFRAGAGAIDAVSLVTETTFVSGSDSGAVAYWSVSKKKPVASTWHAPGSQVCSVAAMPFSDVVASGADDGWIRFYRIEEKAHKLVEINKARIPGFVNAMAFSSDKSSFMLAAAGQEHRAGRWRRDREARNAMYLIPLGEDGSCTQQFSVSGAHMDL